MDKCVNVPCPTRPDYTGPNIIAQASSGPIIKSNHNLIFFNPKKQKKYPKLNEAQKNRVIQQLQDKDHNPRKCVADSMTSVTIYETHENSTQHTKP